MYKNGNKGENIFEVIIVKKWSAKRIMEIAKGMEETNKKYNLPTYEKKKKKKAK